MYFHDCNGEAGKKSGLEEDTSIQWNTHTRNVTTNFKVNIYFTLPALSTTNGVAWTYNVNDSAKGRCDMLLGLYLLT